jgi:hypothetical protein
MAHPRIILFFLFSTGSGVPEPQTLVPIVVHPACC